MNTQEHTNAADVEEIVQVVSFALDSEEFGIPILYVQEIIRMHQITLVPNTAAYVKGVINLRGQVLPVVDLRERIGLPVHEYGEETRVVVVNIRELTLGLIVDRVYEVVRIVASRLEPPPEMVSRIDTGFVDAVAKLENKLLLVLDLASILHISSRQESGF